MFNRACRGLVIAALLGSLTSLARADAPDSSRSAKLNDGYSLLYGLCADEKQLELILMVKTTPPDVGAFAKSVSQEAGKDVDILQHFQDSDKYLRLDKVSLPQAELDIRDSIKAEKQHQLLFEMSGRDYTQLLLVSQIEASTYGSNIAKVLAGEEPSADRASVLTKMAARWVALRHRASQLLKAG